MAFRSVEPKPFPYLTTADMERRAGLRSAGISDFTIVCDQHEYGVYRAHLCECSSVLAKAVTTDFKAREAIRALRSKLLANASPQEAREARIDLSADPNACVEAMVNYFYTFDYTSPVLKDEHDVVFHTRMCIIADKYDIEGLKVKAIYKFKTTAEIASYDDLAAAADVAYEASPATEIIRSKIIEAACVPGDFADGSAFEKVMRKHSDLSLAMFRLQQTKLAVLHRNRAIDEKGDFAIRGGHDSRHTRTFHWRSDARSNPIHSMQ